MRVPTAITGLAAAFLLAACTNTSGPVNRQPTSGSGTASFVDGTQQVTIHVGDDFRFHPATITVRQGKVRIVLVHDGTGPPHDWALSAFPADYVPLTSDGQTQSGTFTTPAPGRYRMVCTIHIRQGMTGTLIVRPAGG